MIIVQGAFTISPNHDRPLQIGERLEEDNDDDDEEEEEQEEKEDEEQGRGCLWQVQLQASSLWWFTQPLVFGIRVGAFIWWNKWTVLVKILYYFKS